MIYGDKFVERNSKFHLQQLRHRSVHEVFDLETFIWRFDYPGLFQEAQGIGYDLRLDG